MAAKSKSKGKSKSQARTRKAPAKGAKKRVRKAAASTDKKQWYAFCNVRQHPHPRDPGTLQYLPWTGPMRNTSALASKDKNDHNLNIGHSAMVF